MQNGLVSAEKVVKNLTLEVNSLYVDVMVIEVNYSNKSFTLGVSSIHPNFLLSQDLPLVILLIFMNF